MNIHKLIKGQIFKNYKELCLFLGIEIKTGKAKQLQLKELERYFKYHREGNKFIIDEIFNKPIDKKDNRGIGNNNIDYIKIIEILILDLLAQAIIKENKDHVFLSKNRLFKELKMINDNYSFCKQRIPKLSKYTNISMETVEEWYDSADSTLKRNLEKALNNLKSQALILWTSEIAVCNINVYGYNKNDNKFNIDKEIYIDEYDEEVTEYNVRLFTYYNHREATKEEKKFILHTERETLKELNCDNKQEVIRKGIWQQFKEKVNAIVLNELNIGFYYDSYKILFNEDHVFEEYEKIITYLLNDIERDINKGELNTGVKNRININSGKRHSKAKSETDKIIGVTQDQRLLRRSNGQYIEDNTKLVEILIHKDNISIKDKVKKTKIKN